MALASSLNTKNKRVSGPAVPGAKVQLRSARRRRPTRTSTKDTTDLTSVRGGGYLPLCLPHTRITNAEGEAGPPTQNTQQTAFELKIPLASRGTTGLQRGHCDSEMVGGTKANPTCCLLCELKSRYKRSGRLVRIPRTV